MCSRAVKCDSAFRLHVNIFIPSRLCEEAGRLTALVAATRVERPILLVPAIFKAFNNLSNRATEQSEGEESGLEQHRCVRLMR